MAIRDAINRRTASELYCTPHFSKIGIRGCSSLKNTNVQTANNRFIFNKHFPRSKDSNQVAKWEFLRPFELLAQVQVYVPPSPWKVMTFRLMAITLRTNLPRIQTMRREYSLQYLPHQESSERGSIQAAKTVRFRVRANTANHLAKRR